MYGLVEAFWLERRLEKQKKREKERIKELINYIALCENKIDKDLLIDCIYTLWPEAV